MSEKYLFKIRRKDNPKASSFWEYFSLSLKAQQTVVEALKVLQKHPTNQRGERVAPVVFESGCCQGQCGACLMIINGLVRLACQTTLDSLGHTIVLEPLEMFPPRRDLMVQRASLEETKQHFFKRPLLEQNQTSFPLVYQREVFSQTEQVFFDCIDCGACLEACPQYSPQGKFGGAFFMLQALSSQNEKALISDAGVSGCGFSQNCVKACPKEIPLDELWGQAKQEARRYWLSPKQMPKSRPV